MKIQKVVRVGGEYAKKGEDIKNGDTVIIKSEGTWVTGQFGDQFVVKIETPKGEEKNVNFNQTTINILHDEFGDDTSSWVGKEVIIRVKKDVVANKKVDIYYFVTPNWDFDEYRELENQSQEVSGTGKLDVSGTGKQSVEYPEEDINPEDIPF